MDNFYEEKYDQINWLKYLMTLGARDTGNILYKEKIKEVFKEMNEYIYGNIQRNSSSSRVFTLQDLMKYNGTGGMPSYIAINGIVYDISKLPNELAQSYSGLPLGKDITFIFNTLDKDKTNLLNSLTKVGNLVSEEEQKRRYVYTPEELSKYNGKNGMAAFVAIYGVVYDISALPSDIANTHKDVPLGQDVSELFASGHYSDKTILEYLPVVGKLDIPRDNKDFTLKSHGQSYIDLGMSRIEIVRELLDKSIFTLEQLSLYNGEGGMPAFIAVDGIVYDVTNSDLIKVSPYNQLKLGTDLSQEFKSCHDNKYEILNNLTIVGKLALPRENNKKIEADFILIKEWDDSDSINKNKRFL